MTAISWFNYEIQSDELCGKSWSILVSKSSFTSTNKLSRTPHKYWQLFRMTVNSYLGFTKTCTNKSKYNPSFIHRVAGSLVGAEKKKVVQIIWSPGKFPVHKGLFLTGMQLNRNTTILLLVQNDFCTKHLLAHHNTCETELITFWWEMDYNFLIVIFFKRSSHIWHFQQNKLMVIHSINFTITFTSHRHISPFPYTRITSFQPK